MPLFLITCYCNSGWSKVAQGSREGIRKYVERLMVEYFAENYDPGEEPEDWSQWEWWERDGSQCYGMKQSNRPERRVAEVNVWEKELLRF